MQSDVFLLQIIRSCEVQKNLSFHSEENLSFVRMNTLKMFKNQGSVKCLDLGVIGLSLILNSGHSSGHVPVSSFDIIAN